MTNLRPWSKPPRHSPGLPSMLLFGMLKLIRQAPEDAKLSSQSCKERGSAMERWYQLLLCEKAASSVEYGLLVAGIAFVIFISIMTLGQTVYDKLYSGAEKLFQ